MYSKSEYTIESVTVPIRLHDDSRQTCPIAMKLFIQNSLNNISAELEDESDSPGSSAIARRLVFPQLQSVGSRESFLKFFFHILKHKSYF